MLRLPVRTRYRCAGMGHLLVLALSGTVSACCNADEERAVSASAGDSLQITRAGVTRKLQLISRVGENEIEASEFRALFGALSGNPTGESGIILSVGGTDPATDELVALSLHIPASLQRGARYEVTGAFSVPVGFSLQTGAWGGADLPQPGRARVAFTTALYTFPPPTHTATYQASRASGVIDVVRRGRDFVELALNLQLSDGAERSVLIRGNVHVQAERFTPPCT